MEKGFTFAVLGAALLMGSFQAPLHAKSDPDRDPPLAALGSPPIPPDNPSTPAKVERVMTESCVLA